MVFSGISLHTSKGFPGGGAVYAVLRSFGRPGAFRVYEGARTGPFSRETSSEKSVLNRTYLSPFFSTFQRSSRARSGAQIRRTQIWLKSCTLRTRTQISKKMEDHVAQDNSKRHEVADAASSPTPGSSSRSSSSSSS